MGNLSVAYYKSIKWFFLRMKLKLPLGLGSEFDCTGELRYYLYMFWGYIEVSPWVGGELPHGRIKYDE